MSGSQCIAVRAAELSPTWTWTWTSSLVALAVRGGHALLPVSPTVLLYILINIVYAAVMPRPDLGPVSCSIDTNRQHSLGIDSIQSTTPPTFRRVAPHVVSCISSTVTVLLSALSEAMHSDMSCSAAGSEATTFFVCSLVALDTGG